MADNMVTLVRLVLAIILPPLGVFLKHGLKVIYMLMLRSSVRPSAVARRKNDTPERAGFTPSMVLMNACPLLYMCR
jgi:hypothetical protein